GVLLTSANAAQVLAGRPDCRALLGLPTLAVGERTATAAREAGFTAVESVDGDVAALGRAAAHRFIGTEAPLLYPCGRDRGGDLVNDLGRAGITTEAVVVYQAVAAERLPQELIESLKAARLDGVLHFSARSARAYLAAA